jgi:hypothetical protein
MLFQLQVDYWKFQENLIDPSHFNAPPTWVTQLDISKKFDVFMSLFNALSSAGSLQEISQKFDRPVTFQYASILFYTIGYIMHKF